jgi:lysozyme
MGMTYSKSGLSLTESFEGLRLTAYQDSVGKWTIGYGHTLGVTEGMTCSQAQAEEWLENDINWAVFVVNNIVKVPLSQGEFDGLVDFCFNCGAGNFKSSTLLKLVNAGDMEDAAKEFEKWDHAGGVVVAGLLRRRVAEEQEFQEAN